MFQHERIGIFIQPSTFVLLVIVNKYYQIEINYFVFEKFEQNIFLLFTEEWWSELLYPNYGSFMDDLMCNL